MANVSISVAAGCKLSDEAPGCTHHVVLSLSSVQAEAELEDAEIGVTSRESSGSGYVHESSFHQAIWAAEGPGGMVGEATDSEPAADERLEDVWRGGTYTAVWSRHQSARSAGVIL